MATKLLLAMTLALLATPVPAQDLMRELRAAGLVVAGTAQAPVLVGDDRVWTVTVSETLVGEPRKTVAVLLPGKVGLHVLPLQGQEALYCLTALPRAAQQSQPAPVRWMLQQGDSSLIPLPADQRGPLLGLARALLAIDAPPAALAGQLAQAAVGPAPRAAREATAALAGRADLHPHLGGAARQALLLRLRSGQDSENDRVLQALLLADLDVPGLDLALMGELRPGTSLRLVETVGRIFGAKEGDQGVLRLMGALERAPDVASQAQLLRALAATGVESCVPPIQSRLQRPELREIARDALLRTGFPQGFEQVAQLARSGDQAQALATVAALEHEGSRMARTVLKKLAEDHADAAVRKRAAQALNR